MWNETTDFRSAGRLYNYWRPVNLSFLSNTILGPHWAERELSHASSKNICLSKARPVSITALSSTFWTPTRFYQRFTFFNLDIICSEIASFRHAVLPMACSYRNERSAKVVKHPPYTVYSREKLAPSQTSQVTLHNWRFMSQRARRTRHFARVCLAWLIRRLLCRLNLYVGGLCGHG